MLKCHTLIVISLFLLLIQRCRCEVYTAMVDLEDLLDTEHVLIDTVENYIKAEEQKIDLLKRYVAIYQRQQKKAREDAQSYLSNPINAYTLVKRLTADWTQVEALVNTNMNADTLANISYVKQNMKFPTDEDLNGAAVALMRLQDTYRLDTSSLARGELNGVKYSAELSAADCFELGRQSYNNGDYYHTQLWMEEAGARFKREANETVDQSDILEYLAFSIYKQGNVALALDLTNKLLELTPTHSRALGNKVYYQDQLKGQEKETPNYDDPFGKDLYEALCRGEVSTPVEVQAKLKCRYLSRDNPFLKLAPFKVEEAHLEPDLFIFHDVMSDKEIETIKRLAQPRSLLADYTGDLKKPELTVMVLFAYHQRATEYQRHDVENRLLGECSLENLEELILSNASHLTAVSVQLLAENCPKLRVLGSLTSWDITPEELDALRILIAVSNTDLTLWPITF
ncbi:hypothetical protein HUJ04_006098 [Dendroctonus ponderosae]|nr:hypothetical protein HUJ04_006098 [Dendroctonus ponderosae]